MLSPAPRRAVSWSLAVLLPVTLAGAPGLAGCYNRYDVVPTELVKLNAARSATATGVTGATYVSTGRHTGYMAPTYGTSRIVDDVKMVRADGGVVEVRGDADVEVQARGRSTRFSSPILAELRGDQLVVRGDNGGQAFALGDIQRATVVEFSPGKTALSMLGIGLGVVVLLGLVAVVAGDDPNQ